MLALVVTCVQGPVVFPDLAVWLPRCNVVTQFDLDVLVLREIEYLLRQLYPAIPDLE